MRGSNRLKLEIRRALGPFGAFVAIAVAGLIALGWVLNNQVFQRPWDDYVEFQATFSDAKGVLPKKQEVRIAGVRVGLIKSAELAHGEPRLTLAVEKRYAPIYRDARLRLRPQTALEDKFIELDRGSPQAGTLSDGGRLSLSNTGVPVDASRILQTFNAETTQHLRFMLAGLGKGLDDGGAGLRRAFAEASPLLDVGGRVATQIARRRVLLRRLVSRTARISQAIGERDEALAALVREGNGVLGTLARRDVPLGATLQALPGTIDALDRAFTSLRAARVQLDPALASLRPAAKSLEPALKALDNVSGDLRPAARGLLPAASALAPLARHADPLSQDLAATVGHLNPQVPDLELATKQLAACHTQFRNFFVWTTSLFKLDDANQALGRGDVTGGPPIVSHRISAPPETVGEHRQAPQRGSVMPSFGLARRTPTCTEAAQLTTFPAGE